MPGGIPQNSNQTDGSLSKSGSRDDDEVEEVARRSINQLGFMLRAPLTAATSIAWAVSAPVWLVKSQSLTCLSIKGTQQAYKNKIVQPWLESLSNEGEKSLRGIIELSSKAARDALSGKIQTEDTRYARELETKKKPLDETTVSHLVTAFVNLLAAEEALQGLNGIIGQRKS